LPQAVKGGEAPDGEYLLATRRTLAPFSGATLVASKESTIRRLKLPALSIAMAVPISQLPGIILFQPLFAAKTTSS
jgi:hypothetical protein